MKMLQKLPELANSIEYLQSIRLSNLDIMFNNNKDRYLFCRSICLFFLSNDPLTIFNVCSECSYHIHNNLISRSEGATSKDNKVFLLFFGISRARKLKSSNIYEEDRDGEVSTIDMLQKILCNGPKNGIHSIVWGESVKGIEGILGDRFGALFDKRIAYDLDAEAMETLVAEEDSSMFKGKTKTAVYLDINNDIKNTHFRPYEIPAKVWIERFSEV